MKKPKIEPEDPALRRARDLLAKPGTDLEWHYEFALALADLRQGEGDKRRTIQSVSNLLGLPRFQVHEHLKLIGTITRDQIAGLSVPWTSLVAVLAVHDSERRLELLHAASEGGWPLTRVRRAVRRAQPAFRPSFAVRKVKKDLEELWVLAEAADDWLAREELWQNELPAEERRKMMRAFLQSSRRKNSLGWDADERVLNAASSMERLVERASSLAVTLRAELKQVG